MKRTRPHAIAQAMATIAPDRFLEAVLGYPAFRVDSVYANAPKDVMRHRVAGHRAFYHTRIPTDDVATLARFTATGWRVIDVNVQFSIRPPDAFVPDPVRDVVVSSTRDRATDVAVADIAERCFQFSRFHLDPDISNTAAHAIKRAWVENYVHGTRGDRLFTAMRDDRPAGFLAAARAGGNIVIELVGVDAPYQRCGVGSALLAACLDAYREEDAVVVGTQVANTPSIRCYERMGFRFSASTYILHRHVR